MDRADDTLEPHTVPSTGWPAPHQAKPHGDPPRPLPPAAFAPERECLAETEALAVDAVLSQIDAEAAERSLAAAAAVQADVCNRPAQEPRLPPPAPPPAFTTLVVDPASRPDFVTEARPLPEARDHVALAKRALRIAALVAAGWLALVLLLILAYRFVDPPMSALMLQQRLFGQSISQTWVPIESMSPNIVRAVIASEDGRFCQHSGVDYEAIGAAMEQAGRGALRGASTISMQVIKNLFLWPSKSYLRKAIELPLTYVMELVWPKRRIIEVYLNIAEWGPGIFGIEAASRYHFRKPARLLSPREAARLAVALPNPLVRNASQPGPGTRRLAEALQVRMRIAPSSQTACALPRRLY